MSYKMFIDDERFPATDGWVIVRSSAEAIALIERDGFPEFISFDHDLGGDDTSMRLIKYMINAVMDDESLPFPRKYDVHSQNPVGAANIRGLMDWFIEHLGKEET